jgi:hypothetical protein
VARAVDVKSAAAKSAMTNRLQIKIKRLERGLIFVGLPLKLLLAA